eukprot:5356342-Pyramimonas_sp.AAC.1
MVELPLATRAAAEKGPPTRTIAKTISEYVGNSLSRRLFDTSGIFHLRDHLPLLSGLDRLDCSEAL